MERRDKLNYFLLGVTTAAVVFILLICGYKYLGIGNDTSNMSVGEKANYLEAYIDKYNWKDVKSEDLEKAALKGMMLALNDKYAAYYTQEEYESAMSELKGSYTGIGIAVAQKKDTKELYVAEVYEDSPAMKAGVKAGDLLKAVGDVRMEGKSLDESTALMHKQGDKMQLTLSRDAKEYSVTLMKDEVKKKSTEYSMLPGKIGYIQISEFDDETPAQFRTAVESLDKQGQKGLIIDLRDNGGGSLTAVISMLDEMVPKGPILTVKSKKTKDEVYSARSDEEFTKPCAILMNGYSASASEVFAGTMQDNKKAVLVGEQSFGKGIVQSVFSLKKILGGGAVKLTTGEYYLPSGRSIHQKGLTPDVTVKYTGERKNYSKAKDNQLQKAVSVIEAKIK